MDTTASYFLPPQSSTIAPEVDALFYFILYMSVAFMIIIYGGVGYLAWKYRRRGEQKLTDPLDQNHGLEIAWTVIPSLLVVAIFAWGFKTYMTMNVVPRNAIEVKVTAQMWFWSFDYPSGANTVGELVAPVDQPIKLLMSSQDVLHSFYVPDFRVKMDVIPNRYTVLWFEATRVGEYNLFCTEYCGKGHSEMLGKVKVLSDADYRKWLESQGDDPSIPLPELGAKLFKSRACVTCHTTDGSKGTGPSFKGIFGKLAGVAAAPNQVVDENYIRESILNPQAKIVAGFDPVMPTYQGILKDRQIDAMVAYIKSLQ